MGNVFYKCPVCSRQDLWSRQTEPSLLLGFTFVKSQENSIV